MSKHLKNWWEQRKAKHYLKNHWHLIADIVLLLIILGLVINLIIINQSSKQPVNTNPVAHVSKITASTTNETLIVKTENNTLNIYSGKAFTFHLSLENKGTGDINNLVLSPAFSNSSFIISKVENTIVPSSIKVKNNKLVLEKIGAGEMIETDISVIVNAKTESSRSVVWFLKATYDENNQIYTKNYDLDTLKLISELKVKAAAYYTSQLGDQLGSGPIPPMVGLPTNYWVFFEANNHGNDLSSLTVSAKLPESVTLTNSKTLSAGEFAYDESQKRITWSVKNVSATGDRYQFGFQVQLIPTEKQVDLKPLLVTNISYLATDSYTGEKLSGKLPYIDTELPLDIINQGQGKVLK
jgi:hypothetical protein